MSADLLAAFGSDMPPSGDEETETSTLQPNLDQYFPRPRPLAISDHSNNANRNARPLWETDRHGADVLFDASDHEADDDSGNEFGDFEDVQELDSTASGPYHGNELSGIDLLGLNDPSSGAHVPHSGVSGYVAAPGDPFAIFGQTKVRSENVSHAVAISQSSDGRPDADGVPNDDWGNFEDADIAHLQSGRGLTPTTDFPKSQTSPPQSSSIQFTSDDEWEKFEDGPQPAATLAPVEASTPQPRSQTSSGSDKDIQSISNIEHTMARSPAVSAYPKERPTNVPPPFSLLQLITPAVQTLSALCRPFPPEGELIALANAINSLYRTTSRIIAGRAHRWKRDAILSQSMRISFAGHKSTGMKLTSLDRSESIKEDQEAIEATSSWTKHNHTLNPVLLKAKLPKPAMSLNANMKSRPASGPGILTDREPCVICGLKRNERVVGIDVKLDDIFDEFWIEHWGHTDCRQFWFEHKGLLSQR